MNQARYAIVGYAFRMPGGIATADGFWRLLAERAYVREPVAGRYGPGYEPVGGQGGPGRFGSAYEGLMRGDEPYLFDCHLFGVPAREASVMDPQLRMLLTCAWEAFEQAGWDHARLRNSRTGVFVGAQVSASGSWRPPYGPNEFAVTGTSLDMLPNRISYAFNLTGPSATYMTACSSGATALHAAVTALVHGDCDQAVVGASTFLGSAQTSAGFARLGVISPDGGCRSFDATANGYMRSEGVFVYLVKPLAAAEADGDRILAVIASTAANTAGAADGATGTGPGRMITAPTEHAQVALMRAACARAGLFPREVDYLEAHATGTRVGDRIEGNAIRRVFGGPDRETPLRVASVKSNVGHMEAAAFGCALLKVLLMFERRTYAPVSRHFTVPNPDIDFTGLRVQTECEPFGAEPVVAGINSFGFGGANGHCLLTEYRPTRRTPAPAAPAAPVPGTAFLVPLSARSPEALRGTARELAELVAPPAAPAAVDSAASGPAAQPAGAPEIDLRTLAGNLSTRRTHYATRAAFVASDLTDLAGQLAAFAGDPEAEQPAASVATVDAARGEPRVLMVFAGQGTQWAGCGRELYAAEPAFRATVDAVDAAWRELAGFSLRDECFGAPQERLDECQLAQPVIFMIEAALTELLRSWGVRPACVIGHSAGEVAAAYAAGIYSLTEATRLIFNRAVQQQRTAGSGRMLAVGLDRAATEELLRAVRDQAGAGSTLEIACENAPMSTVACGSAADVELAAGLLAERGVQHRLLRGNVAFHSRAMDVIEADLRASLAFLDSLPLTGRVPFISSVTGEVTSRLDAAYWWANVRRPVRFAAAVATAARDFRPDVVLEVAPHSALLPAVRQCLDDQGPGSGSSASSGPAACVPTLARGADSAVSFHEALGALYREGASLDFAGRYPRVRPVTHLLPPHPRDERRVMNDLADDAFFLKRGEYSAGPLLGRRIPGDQPRFEVRMSAADFPWLADHRVQNTSIMPAAGYVEMVLEALGGAPAHFAQVEFLKPCVLGGTPARLQTELIPEPGEPDAFSFRITSRSYDGDSPAAHSPVAQSPAAQSAAAGEESVLHCAGKVRRLPVPLSDARAGAQADAPAGSPAATGIDALDQPRFTVAGAAGRKAFYERMAAVIGEYFQYGPHFQVVHGIREDPRTRELLLDIRIGEGLWRDSQRAGYLLPPALLDGGLQSLLHYTMESSDVSAVPRRMEGFTVDRLPTSPRLLCHYAPPAASGLHERGQLAPPLGEQGCGSLTLYDAATGDRVARLGVYVGSFANPRQDVLARSRHVIRWQPKFIDPAIAALAAGPGGTSQPVAGSPAAGAAVTGPALGSPAPVSSAPGGDPAAAVSLGDLIRRLRAAVTARGGMPPVLRVAEFAQETAPGQTAAARLLSAADRGAGDHGTGDHGAANHGAANHGAGFLRDVEFWLFGASPAATRELSEAFAQPGGAAEASPVRFAVGDLSDPGSVDFATGLPRTAACDIVVTEAPATGLGDAQWDVIGRLLVPGGLALVRHAGDPGVPPGAGWTPLRADERSALWAAPAELATEPATLTPVAPSTPVAPTGPRWLVGGARSGLADAWASRLARHLAARVTLGTLEPEWLWSAQVQEELRGLRAVDFFSDEPGAGLAEPGDASAGGSEQGDPSAGPGAPGGADPLGERLVARFLEFLRALVAAREGIAAEDKDTQCRVTVITRQAVSGIGTAAAGGGDGDPGSPRAAALWGAVRALGHELDAGLDLRLVDIGEAADLGRLRWLATHDVRERELAVRDGRLYAPRLVTLFGHGEATAPAAEVGRYQLQSAAPGQITGLALRSVPAVPPGPGEVTIDVAAAALNFRDVMVALDMLPLASYERSALGRQIGIEASGTVAAVGAGVSSVRPGDPVLFMAGGCVASSVTVPEMTVFAKPAALSMPQAAAALSVYVTAYYALVDLARLRPGQRVLIHSAMGGVGQAAIALAKRAGAVVYATAGTAAKRERLRELGVAAAFDSHSFGWYDELMAATGGAGVDVVLNSLAGRHIALCLAALAPGGWHCEIGKVDIYADAALGMSVFRKNLRFAAIDVDRLMNDDPGHARKLTLDCLRLLDEGAVPPLPVTAYPYERYTDALRFMASGQHEGKIVLVAPDAADARRLPVTDRRPFLDPEATYLITGGFGGLGQHLAGYLVAAGARHLTLLDRDPAGRRDADWVRHASGIAHFFPDADVRIDIVPGDVCVRDDVDRVVKGLTRPLKGVFHLAAVLDDRQLADITPESVATVFAAKAGGAWNLHQATLAAPLDHFVLLSSLAAVVGNAGQSVYAAANAFLDGLAAQRASRGLPALAFNMAALAEAGMAARQPHVLRLMRASGMPPVSLAVAIAGLDAALRGTGKPRGYGDHVVCADIGQLPGDADHPDFMRTGRWMRASAFGADGADGETGLTAEVIAAELCREISRLSEHEQVGPRETIASFGVNSVSIAELSAFVRTRYGHHVGILDLMTTATPESVAHAIIAGKSADGQAASQGAPDETGAGRLRSGVIATAAGADASLPAQCQEDLEFLQRTVRELASAAGNAGEAARPVPADQFKAVFLTGATGFVGRFVLAELLRQASDTTVHCLVRCASAARGLDRIRAALTAAEIWDDAFAARITVWPGDVTEARFGLPEADFARLAGEADAVYHLAADLNLISSYSAVREANTRSFANVLELALTKRVKHVVYASTMGIFPQYFGNFGGEFAGLRIEDEATPDIALMRAVLPPGLVGYPWSKLVVEQSLLFARACGVPVAIMRLPQMGTAASTGYTQSTDIKVRIAMAVLDTGLAPAGLGAQWTEPVDTVSETLVSLSLRPRREHAVYHLVNPDPATHGLTLSDFGLNIREVSYQEFKRACQARGARGPLHGHWPLIDHFADLWFPAPEANGTERSQDRPVSVASVTADLGRASLESAAPGSGAPGSATLESATPGSGALDSVGREAGSPGGAVPGATAPGATIPRTASAGTASPAPASPGTGPQWPGLITTTARSLGWIDRHAADWPYKRPAVSLNAAALRRQAREFAARFDVSFDAAYPPELLEGLDRLVAALLAPQARIRADRHPMIGFDLSRKLWNQASLAAELARHPEIAHEPVDRPVFILGINRTGTTLLHRLLARGSRFWAPYPDEIAHPSLPAGPLPVAGLSASALAGVTLPGAARVDTISAATFSAGTASAATASAGTVLAEVWMGDARRRYADDLLGAAGIAAAMSGIHAVDAGEPEEEFALLEQSFASWSYPLRYDVPDYARWLTDGDAGFAYQVHRQAMRHLSWQRGTRLGGAPRHWLLKMPFHLAELPALAAAYPDAVFIQTHRTPRQFLPSWLSLAESVRSLSAGTSTGNPGKSGTVDKAALGAQQLEFMSRMLTDAARLRAADPALDRRFLDVSYLDLVADPVGTATEIYRHFGWTLDEVTETRMERWHAAQSERRQAERRHQYALSDYGLAGAQVDEAFAGYTDIARALNIRM